MAHPCVECGQPCTCGVKDVNWCESCDACNRFTEPYEEYFAEDAEEFTPCDKCDGHPACEDFGCAYSLGKGRMVKKDTAPGSDDWS